MKRGIKRERGSKEERGERERERERAERGWREKGRGNEDKRGETKTLPYLVITIDTASFSTLSPKTNMLSVGLTSRAWNIASVATGSTAEIRAPNVKLRERERGREREGEGEREGGREGGREG